MYKRQSTDSPTVFTILWEFIDAINSTPEVGSFPFPETEEDCTEQSSSMFYPYLGKCNAYALLWTIENGTVKLCLLGSYTARIQIP